MVAQARTLFRSGRPQQASDHVLALIDQLAESETRLLAQRLEQQRASHAQLHGALIATAVAATVLLVPL